MFCPDQIGSSLIVLDLGEAATPEWSAGRQAPVVHIILWHLPLNWWKIARKILQRG